MRRVRWRPEAGAAFQRLNADQRTQVFRLKDAVMMSPEAGEVIGISPAGWRIRRASAADVHLIYGFVYVFEGDAILILDIEVLEWTPPHADMP
jgi:hypothetical protein